MVTRKRNKWARARERGRRRLRTPAPTAGWIKSELAALTSTSPRTLRYYAELGLFPKVEFRGTVTRYQRVHVLRVLAIKHLKTDRLSLSMIRHRLDGMSESELAAFVSERGMPEAIAVALDLRPTASAPVASVATEGVRVRLLPGLELRVSGDTEALLHRLIREFSAQFTGRTQEEATSH